MLAMLWRSKVFPQCGHRRLLCLRAFNQAVATRFPDQKLDKNLKQSAAADGKLADNDPPRRAGRKHNEETRVLTSTEERPYKRFQHISCEDFRRRNRSNAAATLRGDSSIWHWRPRKKKKKSMSFAYLRARYPVKDALRDNKKALWAFRHIMCLHIKHSNWNICGIFKIWCVLSCEFLLWSDCEKSLDVECLFNFWWIIIWEQIKIKPENRTSFYKGMGAIGQY